MKRVAKAVGRGVKHGSLWLYSVAAWSVIAFGSVFLVVMLAARYVVLPTIDEHREQIAEKLTAAFGQKVTIGTLAGNWEGLHPYLTLTDLRIYDDKGQVSLALERVDSTISWWSLYAWDLRFYALDIYRPNLSVRRDAKGVIHIAGVEVQATEADGSGFSDWLLRQRRISVHDAQVRWQDDQRGARPLQLNAVNFRLENRGDRHRFGLRATPPPELAAPLDLRGDLTGERVSDLQRWEGTLFVEVDYTDIAAWQQWVTFPVAFPSGVGALRLWVGLDAGQLKDLTADVELARVRTRLNTDGTPLELTQLKGRVGWKQFDDGFEVSTQRLTVAAHEGLAQQPVDLNFRVRGAKPESQRGELRANALDLEPLFALAANLPIPKDVRDEFAAFAPAGSVYDLAVKWKGAWPQPQEFSAKARFVNLTLAPVGRLPGFSGITGHVEGSEKNGTLFINSQAAAAELPQIFRERLEFDSLGAQVGWTRLAGGKEWEVQLNNVQFANRDLAGQVYGTYQTMTDAPGVIDLNGQLSRADARSMPRYLPINVARNSRPWIERAVLAGSSGDVRLRVKGDLREFPFPDGKAGQFRVAAKVENVKLDYAEGWPALDGIDADLLFIGNRLDVLAREASLYGTRLTRVRAEIPELVAEKGSILKLTGEAEGPTSDFLRFIDESPVARMIERFTDGITADGRGRLALSFEMPLLHTEQTKLNGAYQFVNNRVAIDPDLPALEQLNARLEFTDSLVRLPGATFNMLGGPATATGTTDKSGAVRVNVQGRANLDSFKQQISHPMVSAMRGAFDWRAVVTLKNRLADLVVESNLQGASTDWPAPLAKAANEPLPMRFERRFLSPQQDSVQLSFGDLVSMQSVRRIAGNTITTERATVVFGGVAPAPERRGIWVSGTAKRLDLDGWLALLTVKGAASGGAVELAGLDVKVDELEVLGKQFHGVALNVLQKGNAWAGTINATEVAGDVSWSASDKGKLTARLKRFDLPATQVPVGGGKPSPTGATAFQPRELPALDVTAEDFVFRGKKLGRLELNAVPEGRDWKIDKLRISNPDGALGIEGLWLASLAVPRTQINVRLDVVNIGKFLDRLGLPPGIKDGTGKIEGPLQWNGVPYDIDYPSLSGTIIIESQKGQFIKLDPGLGKLLGVISLQSIPRRLSLDFRDIFSEGLAYDDIISTVKITRGVAATESMRINAASARIVLSGEVDIVRETQNLRVKVTPFVGDSLSVAGALAGALIGGPIAGVATYVLQNLLRNPVNEMASYEYRITGSWVDPVVIKGSETPAKAEAPEGSVPIPAPADAKNLQLKKK